MPFMPLPEGPAREALCRAAADLDAAEGCGRPHEMTRALGRLARCYRGIGANEIAETTFEHALRWSRLAGSMEGTVELLCDLCDTATTLAEQLDDGDPGRGRGRAARERARDRAFEACTLAGRVADARREVQVLLRISDSLDRCGDHKDAVSLQVRARRLMAGDGPARPDLAALSGVASA
jgi:hypothetical protein